MELREDSPAEILLSTHEVTESDLRAEWIRGDGFFIFQVPIYKKASIDSLSKPDFQPNGVAKLGDFFNVLLLPLDDLEMTINYIDANGTKTPLLEDVGLRNGVLFDLMAFKGANLGKFEKPIGVDTIVFEKKGSSAQSFEINISN